ncbi:helix-turn-helix domain-containing protein [Parasutterella sp.]|uniref:helix-turn-helix domain-containing protein n=1 Tax=Parasutterella sp. TaxID=2049037 RepID=UPI0035230433
MKESTMATIKDIAAKLNEGCSYSEVSKALGISKSTVSKYANRIKEPLHKRWVICYN